MLERLEAAATRWTSPCGAGRLVWRSWGQGPPLVLVHGWAGSWLHWARNIERLSRDFRVIAPDMPGMGESDPAPADLVHEGWAALLRNGLRECLGSTPYALAGFSFGGGIAGLLAAMDRRHCHRVVMVAPGGLAPFTSPASERVRGLPDAERRAALRRNLLSLMLANPDAADDLAVTIEDRNIAGLRIKPLPRGRMILAESIPHFHTTPDFVWGSRDNFSRDELGGRIAMTQSLGVRTHLIPGAGHWLAYEAADAFNALLLDCLARQDALTGASAGA